MLTSKLSLNQAFCRCLVLILCLSLATGCTSLKPLASAEPQTIIAEIKPGDTVRLTTRDGRVREFTVQEVTMQQLVGEQERVNLSDITEIERREFSKGKSFALFGGTLGAIALACIISLFASFRP